MNLFKAVVEDNIDPEKIGRVRIRVLGVHSPKLKDVATEDLPWSECIQPLNYGNTLGNSTFMKVGTWCYCMPLNDSFSEFVVMGAMKGIYNDVPNTDADGDKIGFRDPNLVFPVRKTVGDNYLTYGAADEKNPIRNRVTVGEFTEQTDTSPNAIYPNNEVFEDLNGNIVEIDGSSGNSRIRIQHSSGARVEISVDGDITVQASDNGNIWMETPGLFAIGADGNLIIDNDVKITGSLEVIGEVADKEGNMTSLRLAHDTHGHIGNLGGPTTAPITPDPRVKYIWTGTPK